MEEEPHRLISKLGAARDKQKARPWPLRVLVVLAGATVLLTGLAMLVLPGPAFAVIPLGLFVLALEFVWAEQALAAALKQAGKAKQATRQSGLIRKLLVAAACLLALAGAAAWAFLG